MNEQDNPFQPPKDEPEGYDRGGALVERAVETGVASVKYELAAAFQMALLHPRDELRAVGRLAQMAKRPRFADDATYAFPRGRKPDGSENIISGPSVYLARAIAVAWGHVRHGTKVIDSDEEWETLQGYATDVQTGAHVTQEDRYKKLIQRKRQGGPTQWVKPDERDLRELRGRKGAILERNCILAIIPSDIVDDVLDACSATLRAVAAGSLGKNREDTLRKLVTAWAELGIERSHLETFIGGKLETMSPEHLMALQSAWKSVTKENVPLGSLFDLAPPATTKPVADGPKMPGMDAAKSVTPKDPPGGSPIGETKAEKPK